MPSQEYIMPNNASKPAQGSSDLPYLTTVALREQCSKATPSITLTEEGQPRLGHDQTVKEIILTAAIHALYPVTGFGDINGTELKNRYMSSDDASASPKNVIKGFVLGLDAIKQYNDTLLRDLATILLDRKIGEHSVQEWATRHDRVAEWVARASADQLELAASSLKLLESVARFLAIELSSELDQ